MLIRLSPQMLGCIVIVCGIQAIRATSGNSSAGTVERPARNIYGTLTDIENNFFAFEYLAVSSRTMTNNIPVYAEPSDPKINPTTNTTYLDLADISSFRVARADRPSDNLVKFNDKEYVRILVAFKSNPTKEHPYIVETKTTIYCDEDVDPEHKVPRTLRFNVIKKLTITGFRSADRVPSSTPHQKAKAFDHKQFHRCSQAQKTLQELSEEAQQLPSQQKNSMSQKLENVRDWVGGICNN